VLNVILVLPMSFSDRRTVVCSYKDFNRSTSGIPYGSKIAHSEAWIIELKALLKSMSTRRNLRSSHWVSLVRLHSLQALMSVLLSWRKPPCACVRMLSCSTSLISLSLMTYTRNWFIELSSTTGLQCDGWSVIGPPLWRRDRTPVMSSSVTFVTVSPVVRISLSHCWITFNCSGGLVLMSSAWNESGPADLLFCRYW
jgi:hypothetical protein